MTAACPVIDAQSGLIRGVLQAVDCQTRRFAQSGYDTLADPASPFQAWLTAFLVIYIALLGYRLLFGVGRARLSDLPMSALAIGAVLALTANWSLFQTLVFDLASRAPIEIAGLATAPLHTRGSGLAANPVGALQFAYDELTASATALNAAASPLQPGVSPGPSAGGDAAAAQALWRASQALFLSTAGLFSAAIVAVGVLTAVGPVFVVLMLLRATRGLFTGWLRALAVAALAPMAGWMATILMLAVIAPNLTALADQRASGRLDVETAMTAASVVFVFALVQVALLGAGTLIALGLRLPAMGRRGGDFSVPSTQPTAPAAPAVSRAEALARDLRRPEMAATPGFATAAPSFDWSPYRDGATPDLRFGSDRGVAFGRGEGEQTAPPYRRLAVGSRDVPRGGGRS
jgi:type IV secretion system protein VirB6